eukprot:1535840-Pyramimonas_sp.AAC.1
MTTKHKQSQQALLELHRLPLQQHQPPSYRPPLPQPVADAAASGAGAGSHPISSPAPQPAASSRPSVAPADGPAAGPPVPPPPAPHPVARRRRDCITSRAKGASSIATPPSGWPSEAGRTILEEMIATNPVDEVRMEQRCR